MGYLNKQYKERLKRQREEWKKLRIRRKFDYYAKKLLWLIGIVVSATAATAVFFGNVETILGFFK